MGQTNLFIFSVMDKIRLKDKKDNTIIFCKIIDCHIFNFIFEMQVFNDGASRSKFVFGNIENITISTIGGSDLYKLITYLELIKIIITGNHDKIKIWLSDEYCVYDDTNAGTLEIEVDYMISDKVKTSYCKIINLMQKISSIKNDCKIDFILNFGLYLRYIKEIDMFNALDVLKDDSYQKNIFIGNHNNFNFFLRRDTDILVYKIVRRKFNI